MATYGKVEISPNRHDWRPMLLPEQVVLVTTIDAVGEPHVATKSRLTVISYGPPTILVFACRRDYQTAANLGESRQFVINIPGEDLIATSWMVGSEPQSRGRGLLAEHELTPIPSVTVRPPRIAECRAHLECDVVEIHSFGEMQATFGQVMAASVNEDLLGKTPTDGSYGKLAPFFFLEAGWTAPLGAPRPVDEPVIGPRLDITVLAVSDMRRSLTFYQSVFDWKIRIEKKGYVEFELPGGRGLALSARESFEVVTGSVPHEIDDNNTSGTQVYLRCEEMPKVIARLHSVGARLLSGVKERDWGDEAGYFADPDGHVLVIARPLPEK